jgi:nitrite reductase/ring-hydroxylating ferredoxin subunit
MSQFVPALKASDIPEGAMLPVIVAGSRLLLSRIEGKVCALSGTCTHEEADLGLGFVTDGRIACPLHLSQFDLRDGSVLNPPATKPLRRFNVKIDGDTVLVEV